MIRTSRLAWVCFIVLLISWPTHLFLRNHVIPTMPNGWAKASLDILLEVNRLLRLAALICLMVLGIKALFRKREPSPKTEVKAPPPLGIKIIVGLAAIYTLILVGAACIRLAYHGQASPSTPIWFLTAATLITALLIGATAKGLWRMRNWAWWTASIVLGLTFLLNCAKLIHLRHFPDLAHWWPLFLYLILFGCLLRPSIYRCFRGIRNE